LARISSRKITYYHCLVITTKETTG